jgi:hypothetical protein
MINAGSPFPQTASHLAMPSDAIVITFAQSIAIFSPLSLGFCPFSRPLFIT